MYAVMRCFVINSLCHKPPENKMSTENVLIFEHFIRYFLSPRFLEKASGILLSPPSVCPSVCPLCYLLPNRWTESNKFGEWLAYTSGACKSTFMFGPVPRGPGEGSKGQILTISKFKVNFKDFYAKMSTYTQ